MATSGRYVAVPFEAKRTNAWGRIEDLIHLEFGWQSFDLSQYNQYTTHAGFAVKWVEIPVEDLENFEEHLSWNFKSDIYGNVSFSGNPKQAIAFFRSLKNRWLLELVPEDSFLVNV